MDGKMKGNGVVAKLLFLISVYEFPYYCNTIYLIIIIIIGGVVTIWGLHNIPNCDHRGCCHHLGFTQS